MDTRNEIVKVSFDLFTEKGESFTLDEVAKTVGIKKASIYFHFANKDEVFYELISREIKEYYDYISLEMESITNSCESNLELVLYENYMSVMRYFKDNRKLFFWERVFLLNPSNYEEKTQLLIEDLFGKRTKYYREYFLKEIEAGTIKFRDIDHLQESMYALINGTMFIIRRNGYSKAEHMFETLWDVFWTGIKGSD